MNYEEKISELDSLIKECERMQLSINENLIWAANDLNTYHDHAGDLEITNQKWICFCRNFETYFEINPDQVFFNEYQKLTKEATRVSQELLSSMCILINNMKNKLKVEKYK